MVPLEHLHQQSNQTRPHRSEQLVQTDGRQSHEEDSDAEKDEDEKSRLWVLLFHDVVERLEHCAQFALVFVDPAGVDNEADPLE